MRLALTAALLAATFCALQPVPAAAQVSCSTVGGTTFCSDGSSSRQVGGSTFYSDGSSSRQVGGSTFYSDGRSSRQTGGSTFYSDGTTSRQMGGSTIFSTPAPGAKRENGTTYPGGVSTCRTIGTSLYCY